MNPSLRKKTTSFNTEFVPTLRVEGVGVSTVTSCCHLQVRSSLTVTLGSEHEAASARADATARKTGNRRGVRGSTRANTQVTYGTEAPAMRPAERTFQGEGEL